MSSKIKILDSELTELATISVASSAVRSEKINSDNILNFSVRVKSGYGEYITDDSIFELDGDYFDVAFYKKEQQGDGKLMISVEAEHVSYRLNAAEYDVEYFTETDTPTAILTAILSGTGFTAGTVDFSTLTTFSLQQAASRRGLLMQFAAYLGGELEFDGFQISILEQRGSSTPKALTVGKDITVVSKSADKRHLDTLGNPTVSYTCGVYKGDALNLGDVVTLDYDALDIDVSLRVVSKAYDPYNPNNVTVEIGNYVNALEDDLYRIETQAVRKDALMNGTRIGPEYGFEAVRNDKKARAFFKSDGFKMQSGDGTGGNWKDRIYFDPVEGNYIFDGKLSADVIEAVSALITASLYASTGYIDGLTVGELSTSIKLNNYLNEDASTVDYISIKDKTMQFITAAYVATDPEQATNSNGSLLYWVSEDHKVVTTTETEYPAMQYVYNELTKLKLFFEYNGTNYIPKIVFGAGTGVGDNGKMFMYKDEGAFHMDYVSTAGTMWSIWIDDDGVHFDGVPQIVYETITALVGVVQIWVQEDTPMAAKVNDIWVDTNDYSRYDRLALATSTTLSTDAAEFITATGTITITLHAATAEGIIKKIHNVGSGIVTIAGTVNGSSSGMLLFPGESVELITDGSGWRM